MNSKKTADVRQEACETGSESQALEVPICFTANRHRRLQLHAKQITTLTERELHRLQLLAIDIVQPSQDMYKADDQHMSIQCSNIVCVARSRYFMSVHQPNCASCPLHNTGHPTFSPAHTGWEWAVPGDTEYNGSQK